MTVEPGAPVEWYRDAKVMVPGGLAVASLLWNWINTFRTNRYQRDTRAASFKLDQFSEYVREPIKEQVAAIRKCRDEVAAANLIPVNEVQQKREEFTRIQGALQRAHDALVLALTEADDGSVVDAKDLHVCTEEVWDDCLGYFNLIHNPHSGPAVIVSTGSNLERAIARLAQIVVDRLAQEEKKLFKV